MKFSFKIKLVSGSDKKLSAGEKASSFLLGFAVVAGSGLLVYHLGLPK